MDLSDTLNKLHGVGGALSKKLSLLQINNVGELLTYFPRRYDDYSNIIPINKTKPGPTTVKIKIISKNTRRARKGLAITEAIGSDQTGSIYLVWFNQPYRANSLKEDVEYFVSGEFGLHRQRMSMINPSIELVSNFPINTARIVPIYRETKGLTSIQIRKAVKSSLEYLKLVNESLPGWMIKKYSLTPINKSIEIMHFPVNNDELNKARDRIAFEEVFDLILASQLSKNELLNIKSLPIAYNNQHSLAFIEKLPFKLTDEQKSVAWQILKDIQKDTPMNRLLEGDVGTGKTIVATMAAYIAIKEGFQVAFMAPTEILAKQHADTIYKILKDLESEKSLSLLVGSMNKKSKGIVINKLETGEIKFIVGTHSLIQDKVKLNKLGLVIIDEQHRFGVKQRQTLMGKTGNMPHVLSMTATPIPRSLQLTLYGDLDISIIKNKPYSDLPVKTKITSLNQRTGLYNKLVPVLDSGKQIFVVCPLITMSNDLPFRSAETVYKELSQGVFKNFNIGLLHGKLKTEEKEKVMNDFVNNKINILVATTIIEVGVNVPNASVMIIESAERFGLAQIHQLRGRVGRNHEQGYCYLLLDDNNNPSQRLMALESTTDGFKLAELDLKLRGPGIVYGTMQHGHDGIDLRFARLTDHELIMKARNAALEFIAKKENLLQYIQLNERVRRIRAITNLN